MKSRKMLNNIVEGEKHLLGGMPTQELRHLLGDKLPILNFIIKAAHELLQNKNEKRNDKVKSNLLLIPQPHKDVKIRSRKCERTLRGAIWHQLHRRVFVA